MNESMMQVKKCPRCSGLFKAYISADMDFDGSVTWTDGQVIGPRFVKDEAILSCPSCKTPYWLKNIETVDEYDDDLDLFDEEGGCRHQDIPMGYRPSADDLLKLLKLGSLEKDDELYIRVSVLHLLNDRRRDGFGPAFGEADRSNLERLAEIIEPESLGKHILLGEVYRELGKFEEAERLMSMASPRNDEWVMYIGYLASIRDDQVRPYCDVPKEYASKICTLISNPGSA